MLRTLRTEEPGAARLVAFVVDAPGTPSLAADVAAALGLADTTVTLFANSTVAVDTRALARRSVFELRRLRYVWVRDGVGGARVARVSRVPRPAVAGQLNAAAVAACVVVPVVMAATAAVVAVRLQLASGQGKGFSELGGQAPLNPP